jgi:hypothetical protein
MLRIKEHGQDRQGDRSPPVVAAMELDDGAG